MEIDEGIKNCFQGLSHHLSVKGVLDGVVEGRIWAGGGAALMENPQGIMLGGEIGRASCRERV